MYVGPTSTTKEKMLSMRAQLLQNQKGLKVNNMDLPFPTQDVEKKVLSRKGKIHIVDFPTQNVEKKVLKQ